MSFIPKTTLFWYTWLDWGAGALLALEMVGGFTTTSVATSLRGCSLIWDVDWFMEVFLPFDEWEPFFVPIFISML